MRAFVTGATGRLGKVLVNALHEMGHEVRVLVRSEEKMKGMPRGILAIFGDLSKPAALEIGVKNADTVFHLASVIDPAEGWERIKEVNVTGTKNLIGACSKHNVKRFIFTSSTAVYGKPPLETPTTEKTKPRPTDIYGKSKLEAEKIVGEHFSDVPSTIIRPSVIYGPTYLSVYARVFNLLEKGKMKIFGDGKNVIPFVHSGDVVRAMLLAAKSEKAVGKTYNVVENKTMTQEQIYQAACEALGVKFKKGYMDPKMAKLFISISSIFKESKITGEDIDHLASHRVFDTSLIENELKWKPKIKLDEGIRQMVALYMGIKKRKEERRKLEIKRREILREKEEKKEEKKKEKK